jgi:hypothetical protein
MGAEPICWQATKSSNPSLPSSAHVCFRRTAGVPPALRVQAGRCACCSTAWVVRRAQSGQDGRGPALRRAGVPPICGWGSVWVKRECGGREYSSQCVLKSESRPRFGVRVPRLRGPLGPVKPPELGAPFHEPAVDAARRSLRLESRWPRARRTRRQTQKAQATGTHRLAALSLWRSRLRCRKVNLSHASAS